MISVHALKQGLQTGEYDARLSRVYCCTGEALRHCGERIGRAAEEWCRTFGRTEADGLCIFSAPGRTELGGNHTDHQRGKVLTGSVDLDAIAAAAPNGGRDVRIFSEGYGQITVNCDALAKGSGEENTTAALIRGVLAGIAAKGYAVGGFDGWITSDVPGGSGLSSSACIEVLLGEIVNGLFCGGSLTPEEIAKIGQFAENTYFGKPSGLLDQMGCAVGGMIAIDFAEKENPRVHRVDYNFADSGYDLFIIDTGANHADLTGDYAAVPAEMRAAAACFGKEVLSEVPEEAFRKGIPEVRRQAGDRAALRGIHYYNECRRVERMTAALEQGDFDRYLALVNESGRSSFMYLQNIATYRDPAQQPVAAALAVAEDLLNGEGAVRVHGGGFAGTIQAYVPKEKAEAFRQGMDALLGEGACRRTCIRPVGGCTLLE